MRRQGNPELVEGEAERFISGASWKAIGRGNRDSISSCTASGVGVNGPAILARMLSYPARLFEWGLVQWYALVMTAGLVGFVFYYVYH